MHYPWNKTNTWHHTIGGEMLGTRNIKFWVECTPPRTTHQSGNTILKTKSGRLFVGKNHKGKKVANQLMAMVSPYAPSTPFKKPIKAEICWVYPWRTSDTKANKQKGVIPCSKRPDADNIAKGVLDACQKAGFYIDDAQVYDLHVQKAYGTHHGVYISITEMDYNG
jgi:Holliday junction resolvase RusA-like endonuclease